MFKANINRQLLISSILLLAILFLETFSDLDLSFQQYFYRPESASWPISSSDHKNLRIFFYDGPKILIGGLGLAALTALTYSFIKFNLFMRRRALVLFMSILLVPLIVAGSKQYTNIYCPKELVCFGGRAPYQRVLAVYDQAGAPLPKGRCFPAGHATGGFALMSLFFCFSTRKRQVIGLSAGLTAGWAMGLYQMLRGEHFLSHTLASMTAAWIIILLVEKLAETLFPNINQSDNQSINLTQTISK